MKAEEKKYVRMSLNERVQHFLLLVSFITLVITGFALKFPDSWLGKLVIDFLGKPAFDARGVVHRVASVVMVGVSIYHLGYIFFTARGKKLIRDLWPLKKDASQLMQSLFYLIGRSKSKPEFGRFSYIEKMEYWAVVWGTIVMGVTGGALWLENTFLRFIGTEGMYVATLIHFYEAILASLAIVVWHFYLVFLNPDSFPMSRVWLKGYLTEEEMIKEHPGEYKELLILEPIADKNEIHEVALEKNEVAEEIKT